MDAERDRLDPLLGGAFEPGRDRAAAVGSKLRAGPSRDVQAFEALAMHPNTTEQAFLARRPRPRHNLNLTSSLERQLQ